MGNPLVSSYKGAFVAGRIFSTATGGVRWPPDSLSACSRFAYWLLETLLFSFPFIVGGILLDSLVRNFYLGFFGACGLFAALSFLLVIFLWLGCNLRRAHVVAPDHGDLDFANAKDHSLSLSELIAGRRPFVRTLLYAVVAAILEAFVLYFNFWLTHRNVTTIWTIEMLVRHLLWLADCIAFHSLAVQAPVETATFQPPSGAFPELWHQPLMRPFYLASLVGSAIFLREVPIEGMDHLLVPLVDWFICLLPILWLLGVLSPLDALKLWAGEWFSSTLFGGSPTPSELSLYTKLLVSLVATAITYYLRGFSALFSCIVGFLLSVHLANFQRRWIAVQHLAVVVLSVVATVSEDALTGAAGAELAIGIILALILAVSEVLSSMQSVTVAAGALLNPLWSSFRETRKTSSSGLVHLFVQGIFVHSVSPILMCLLLTQGDLYPENGFQRFLVTLSLIKSYREVFQRVRISIFVAVCVVLLRQCSSDLSQLPLCAVFALISILWHTFVGFCERLYTIGAILAASVFVPKQRLQHNWILFSLNVIFLPWLLIVAATTAFLDSPVMALFSLPIFLPAFPRPRRFWPHRELPDQQRSPAAPNGPAIKGDIVFYAQFIPRLIEKLENHISRGLLGSLQAGSCLLARHQNRLVLLRVVEAGFMFRCVEAKGLELQETSCHSLEAATVDQIIEECFLKEQPRCVNPHASNSFRPRARTNVVTYSSARNVLTGVIDQAAFSEALLNNFSRVLLWVLLHQRAHSIRHEGDGDRGDITASMDMLSEHSRYRPCKSWWYLATTETSPFRRFPSRLFVDSWVTVVAIHIRRAFPDIVMAAAEEPSLCVDYRQICDLCYRAVFPDGPLDPTTIYGAFNGKFSGKPLPADLHDLVRRAVQYTTKLAVDTVIIGEAETETELARILKEYDTRWFIGVEGSPQWNGSIVREVPYLFSIAHDPTDNVFTSHLLSLILDEPVYVGTLSGPTVDAIWATLSLELLYMTNDDDERYSIQAHPWILRNLAIQAADPPLGYPVYVDQPRYLLTLN